MFSVKFGLKSRLQIDSFIDSILQKKLSFFEDTGIDNVDFITENYLKNSEALRKNILGSIVSSASQEVVGKIILEKGECFTVAVGNYMIFVYFLEEIENKVRKIEKIEFFRK